MNDQATGRLMDRLNFTPADLSHNRSGQLSQRQHEHYTGLWQRLRLFMGIVAVLTLASAIYGGFQYFSTANRSTSSPALIFLLFGIGLFIPTFFYWQRYHRLLAKFTRTDLVRSVTGKVSYEIPELQGCLNLLAMILGILSMTSVATSEDEYITIAGVSFLAKPGMKDALQFGKKYTVYYIEGLRDKPLYVLSAEHQE